ncbi:MULTISPECIES: ATP-binding protein [unclassified Pseudomonas]|jgi:anti-sigma regulatory factor (Ser/Thr protein kinase)|uniref:ATP-binding protein n=1 Tax=unclassified Pseudomonas TaxID=196821 RepID=UPI00069F75CD|nr:MULTISPECIES: ATP-binding protein [unclassified Pseudomonas]WPN49914.1 ATP-binding protein [Pseudomonas sp. P8_241]
MNIGGSMTQVLAIEDSSQIGHARRTAQNLAQIHGFDATDAGRVALVATELASNILKHAARGEMHLRVLPRKGGFGIEMLAVDRAQGFDLQACLTDGFSTGGTQGIGLGAVSRQAQVFDVYADHRGAVLLTRLYPREDKAPDRRIGVSQHSLHNDPACGDVWHLAFDGPHISALVIDGLGHGEDAEVAARAGEKAFALSPFVSPVLMMEDLHQAMTATRGGAVAVAQVDTARNSLTFTGIGNIGACLIAPEKSRGLASHPGIVGVQYRKAQPFDYAQVNGQLLIMYSDGLQSRWNLQDYPGLVHRHPAVIAAVLHRDFCRGRDDVTVLVIALEATHG